MDENGHHKETEIDTLWVKRKKFIPNSQDYPLAKQGEATRKMFPGLNVTVRKRICELGWGL